MKLLGFVLGSSTTSSGRRLYFVLLTMLIVFVVVQMISVKVLLPLNHHNEDVLSPMSVTTTTTRSAAVTKTKTQHKIPKRLIFTHYKNLLTTPLTEMNEEEEALAENIRHSISIHFPNYDNNYKDHDDVIFWTDHECIQGLQRIYPSLIPYFKQEQEGMYKADICRGVALYENGGFYLDVDVGVRTNLWLDLRHDTEFVTSLVHTQSHYPQHFFQAILGSTSHNPIINKYLQLFERHYQGITPIEKGPLGVILLKHAYDQIHQEYYNDSRSNGDDDRTDQSDKKKQPTPPPPPKSELYQEVLYNSQIFSDLHPAPIWGQRRACHFVVVAKVNHQENVEFQIHNNNNHNKKKHEKELKHRQHHHKHKNDDDEVIHIHIPIVSRIPGSRMCPDNDNDPQKAMQWWERQ